MSTKSEYKPLNLIKCLELTVALIIPLEMQIANALNFDYPACGCVNSAVWMDGLNHSS